MIEKLPAGEVTALVIEDNEETRSLLVRILNVMGAAEVFEASEGGEGLRVASEKVPTLVVCDMEMEPIDGLSFLAGLRHSQNKQIASIPVIMFTATKDETVVQKVNALGVDGYLVKPFNPKGFSAHVLQVAIKRLGSESAQKLMTGMA